MSKESKVVEVFTFIHSDAISGNFKLNSACCNLLYPDITEIASSNPRLLKGVGAGGRKF